MNACVVGKSGTCFLVKAVNKVNDIFAGIVRLVKDYNSKKTLSVLENVWYICK